jgi:hypothetical protein
MSKYLKIAFLVTVGLFIKMSTFAQGCSECKMRLEASQGGEIAVGNGINVGIMILMAVPYIIIFAMFRKKIVSFLKEFLLMWKR